MPPSNPPDPPKRLSSPQKFALRQGAKGGFWVLRDGRGDLLLGPDGSGRFRLPLWLTQTGAARHAAKSPPDRGRDASAVQVSPEALRREVLPRLMEEDRLVSIRPFADEVIILPPAELERHLAELEAARAAKLSREPGLGQKMLASFVKEEVAPALKERGFRRAGNTWHLRGRGVWGLIFIQKDKWNSGDDCGFTINVEVVSDRLHYFFSEGVLSKNPPPAGYSAGMIHRRLGEFMEPPEDRWWKFAPGCDPDQIAREVMGALLGPAMRFLRGLRTDEDIREFLLRRGIPRGSVHSLVDLAVLTHDLGPREQLPRLIEVLREDTLELQRPWVEAQIRRIFEQDRSSLGPD